VQELLRRDVAVVRLAQDLAGVAQADDENQVEEQIQPGRPAVRVKISGPSWRYGTPSSPAYLALHR
jgi:hypothetical protein